MRKIWPGIGVVAAILLTFCSFHISAATLPPSSGVPPNYNTYAWNNNQANNLSSSDPLAAVNALGWNNPHLNLGPLSIGGRYDTLLGMIFNAQYLQKIQQDWALGLLGEYGPNQYRFNGTLGRQIGKNAQVKLTAEYLSQVLPFKFDSGNINQRVGQAAYGLQFQQNFYQRFFQDINFGGYWAKAPNVGLSNIIFSNNGLWYTNERNIAGAQSQGANLGTDVNLSRVTALGMKIYYDDAKYNTEFSSTPNQNVMGLGEALSLEQILTDRMKLSLSGQLRAIYDTYGATLAWSPQFASALGLQLSLSAQRLVSSNNTPSSNNYGLNMSFLGAEGSKSPAYKLTGSTALSDIGDWVKTPAVYEERVLVAAEQETLLNAPIVSALSPSTGPLIGGNTVIVTGSNFLSGVAVTFGDAAAAVTYISSSELSVIVPSFTTQAKEVAYNFITHIVDVTVLNANGQRTVFSNAYTYTTEFAPTITSVSPNTGDSAGGTSVTLTGTHFTGTTSVTFGGVPATNKTVLNDSTVTVATPAHADGPVSIVLNTPNGIATLANAYIYGTAPLITSLSPTAGPIAGGTSVTINGANLQNTNSVTFGGTSASIVGTPTSTNVTVTTPAHIAGTVNVVLTTPGGTVTNNNAYTYLSAPTVTSLTQTAGSVGATVVINGTNLSDATAVTFGGASATIVSATSSSISVLAPAGLGTVAVTVTTPGGTATLDSAYTYVVITSVSPSTGPTVTVNGSGFNAAASPTLTFGGTTVSSYSVNTDGTQITATVPARATSNVSVNVVFSNTAGTATATNAYTYVPVIFVSSGGYTGDLGGFSGANTKCNADAAKPSTGFAAAYTYRALLDTNNATTSGISYYQTNGTTLIATANSGNLVGSGTLSARITNSAFLTWTGISSVGTVCNLGAGPFTSNTAGGTASAGLASSTSSTYWNQSNISCNTSGRHLYCVAQ